MGQLQMKIERNTEKQQKHVKTITTNWTCTEIYTHVLKQFGSHWGKTVCEVVTFKVWKNMIFRKIFQPQIRPLNDLLPLQALSGFYVSSSTQSCVGKD